MWKYLLMAMLIMLFAAAMARSAEPPPCFIPLDLATVRVKDVDTLHGDLRFPWNITLREQDIRLDFDGLEVSRIRRGVVITDEEIVRGKQARVALEKMLSECQAAYLQPVAQPTGGFDRIAGSLWLQFPEQTGLISVRAWAQQWQYVRSP